MALSSEMKIEIINYVLPEGSFCKGIIESSGLVGTAYEAGEVSGDDIYDFLDECRLILTQRYLNNRPQSESPKDPEGDTLPRA